MSLQQACIESLSRSDTMLTVHPEYSAMFPDLPVYSGASRHRVHSVEGPLIRVRSVRVTFVCLTKDSDYLTLEYPYPISIKRLIRDHNATMTDMYARGEIRYPFRFQYGYENWYLTIDGTTHAVGTSDGLDLEMRLTQNVRISHLLSFLGGPSLQRFRLCTREFTKNFARYRRPGGMTAAVMRRHAESE